MGKRKGTKEYREQIQMEKVQIDSKEKKTCDGLNPTKRCQPRSNSTQFRRCQERASQRRGLENKVKEARKGKMGGSPSFYFSLSSEIRKETNEKGEISSERSSQKLR